MRASTTNSVLIFLAVILFVISLPLMIKGIKDYYLKRQSTVTNEETVIVDNFNDEETDLSGYFEDYVGESDSENSFLRNDPFRDVCSQFDAEEGTTVVYSNVVCFK